MDWDFVGRGVVIGFSIAAPVGPIGVLCIRRTLADGLAAGFISGLGAATADAVYGAIAGLGLTVVAAFLVEQQFMLRLVGGAFLIYLGVQTLRAKPADRPAEVAANRAGLLGAYLSTFGLTLTNPMTILAFAAIFAGIGAGVATSSAIGALALVGGVFVGSAIWWLLLSGGVVGLRSRLTTDRLRWVNWLSGVIILGFGVVALAGVGG